MPSPVTISLKIHPSFLTLSIMKTIMAKSPHDSFSRRYFHLHLKKKVLDDDDEDQLEQHILTLHPPSQRLNKSHSVSKLKSALSLPLFTTKTPSLHTSIAGSRVVGTLFGYRRGRVHISFQEDPKSHPPFLIDLATPTSVLVREMANGVVRIALECEKNKDKNKSVKKLVEEPIWRSYRNGRKCGYANRVECGSEEWKILKAVEPISMGAGVLPASGNGSEGEVMYMRARFERVVASKHSEAYYLINPDAAGGPQLSIFLLRV